jgi:predicted nucleic-acid-binding Zn-ribbon protein
MGPEQAWLAVVATGPSHEDEDMARLTNTLHAFGSVSACPKCRGTELSLEHGRWLSATLPSEAGSEALRVTCRQCGYRWVERCGDDRPPSGDCPASAHTTEPPTHSPR